MSFFTWHYASENRHMKVSGQCPAYNMGVEDITYLLYQYPKAILAWIYMGIEDVI